MRDKEADLEKRRKTVERRSNMQLCQFECKVQFNKSSDNLPLRTYGTT